MTDRQFFKLLYKAMMDSTKRRRKVAKVFKDQSFIRTTFGYPAGTLFSVIHKR